MILKRRREGERGRKRGRMERDEEREEKRRGDGRVREGDEEGRGNIDLLFHLLILTCICLEWVSNLQSWHIKGTL